MRDNQNDLSQTDTLTVYVQDMMEKGRLKRQNTQMTLGKLIATLESHPTNTLIEKICNPHAHRGHYGDLAFDIGTPYEQMTVAETIAFLTECLGATYTGFKGGEITMGNHTPLWIAAAGDVHGLRIWGVLNEGDGLVYMLAREVLV